MEYTVLLLAGFPPLVVVTGLEVNVYGATLIISGPDREPATRCVRRVEWGMVRWGRDSLYRGFLRRDWKSGRVVILSSTLSLPGVFVCVCDLGADDENRHFRPLRGGGPKILSRAVADCNGLAREMLILLN